MGNTVRCCIACVLPCGALDMARVVRGDGRVEEYGKGVTAGEVMKANPTHVLAQSIYQQRPAISFLHPDAELERGKIYLLVPTYNLHKQSKAKPKKHSDIVAPEVLKPEIGREIGKSELLEEQSGNKILSSRRSEKSSSKRVKTAWKPMLNCIEEIEEDH